MENLELSYFCEKLSESDSFDSLPSSLVYNPANKQFIIGDNLGKVHVFNNSTVPVSHQASEDKPIGSIAFTPDGSRCMLVEDKWLNVLSFPFSKDIDDSMIQKKLLRRTLPMTHCEYDEHRSLLYVSSREPDISLCSFDVKSDCSFQSEFKIKTNDVGVRSFAVFSKTGNERTYVGYIDENSAFFVTSLYSTGSSSTSFSCDMEYQMNDVVSSKVTKSSELGCQISWNTKHAMGMMAVPGRQGCINLLIRDDEGMSWNEFLLIGDNVNDLGHEQNDINICVFSPSGQTLLSCDINGTIIIWKQNHEKGKEGEKFKYKPYRKIKCSESSITSICFGQIDSKNDKIYVMVSTLSHIGSFWVDDNYSEKSITAKIVNHATDLVSAKELSSPSTTATKTFKSNKITSPTKQSKLKKNNLTKDGDNDDDDDNDDLFGPTATTTTVTTATNSVPATTTTSITSDAMDIFDSSSTEDKEDSVEKIKNTVKNVITDKRKDILSDEADDDHSIISEDEDNIGDTFNDKANKVLTKYQQQSLQNQVQHLYHEPLYISSTKIDEKGRRYLYWNHIGNITSREESTSNRIEIRFANINSGRYKSEIFNDTTGFTMAAISSEGAVFSNGQYSHNHNTNNSKNAMRNNMYDDNTNQPGSSIYYRAFPGSQKLAGCNEDFTIVLDNGETVISVAVGTGWIAAATSKNWLRLFSSTGLQLGIFWLKGPVVSLVGFEDQLAVIFNTQQSVAMMNMNNNNNNNNNNSYVTNGNNSLIVDYKLNVQTYQILSTKEAKNENGKIILLGETFLPLSSNSTLSWATYSLMETSEMSHLCILDSKGVLSMLLQQNVSNNNSAMWLPILEIEKIKKSSEHKYWPVLIRNNKLAYVLLNGENKPNVYPQAVVASRGLRIPFVEIKEGKDKDTNNDNIHKFLYDSIFTNHLAHQSQEYFHAYQLQLQAISQGSASITTIGTLENIMNMYQFTENKFKNQTNEMDRTTLKMFQEECRHVQRSAQALDLAQRLRNDVAFAAAIKIANHFGRTSLAQKLEDILQQRVYDAEQAIMTATANVQEDEMYTDRRYNNNGNNYSSQSKQQQQSYTEEEEGVVEVVKQPHQNRYPLLMNDRQYKEYSSSADKTDASKENLKRSHQNTNNHHTAANDNDDDDDDNMDYNHNIDDTTHSTNHIKSTNTTTTSSATTATNPFAKFSQQKKQKSVAFDFKNNSSDDNDNHGHDSEQISPQTITAVNNMPSNPFEKKMSSSTNSSKNTATSASSAFMMMSPSPKKPLFRQNAIAKDARQKESLKKTIL